MKMKNVFFMLFLVILFFNLTNCTRSKVKTTPETGEQPVKITTPQETPGKTTEESGKPVKQEEDKNRTIKRETLEETEIPVHDPSHPSKSPVEPGIKPVKLSVTDVFRGFGYPGDGEVPVSFKNRVHYYINYFQNNEKGYQYFLRALKRSQKYLPMIKEAMKKKELPVFLAYLPFIESGFSTTAKSRAGAVGMWQFMRGTARMYGLRVDKYKDERKDAVKATYAAAEYLNDLLSMFGMEDPFLGVCAYNAGEGKILRALRKISYKDRSFWTLVKKGLLRNETNEYIPRLIAAVMVASQPAEYGMQIVPAGDNDERDDLEIIASLHSTKDDLEDESPVVIIMEKAEPQVATPKPRVSKPPRVQKKEQSPYSIYTVRRKDTLYSIAKKHAIKVSTLKKWNGLRKNRIYPGQRLKIFGQQIESEPPVISSSSRPVRSSNRGYRLVYTVNYTDSLARIALFFSGVSARDIMRWNNLRHTRIYPRQKLSLYLPERPKKILSHTVKRGETAKRLAKKYNIRLEFLVSLNGLLTDSRLRPGKKLNIYYF